MDREEGIRIIAYHIWEEEGCCHGSDVEHWLKAEIIWQERNKPARTVAEIEPSARNPQINTAGKTKPATVLSTASKQKKANPQKGSLSICATSKTGTSEISSDEENSMKQVSQIRPLV